jgi:hypothetical protein
MRSNVPGAAGNQYFLHLLLYKIKLIFMMRQR